MTNITMDERPTTVLQKPVQTGQLYCVSLVPMAVYESIR